MLKVSVTKQKFSLGYFYPTTLFLASLLLQALTFINSSFTAYEMLKHPNYNCKRIGANQVSFYGKLKKKKLKENWKLKNGKFVLFSLSWKLRKLRKKLVRFPKLEKNKLQINLICLLDPSSSNLLGFFHFLFSIFLSSHLMEVLNYTFKNRKLYKVFSQIPIKISISFFR